MSAPAGLVELYSANNRPSASVCADPVNVNAFYIGGLSCDSYIYYAVGRKVSRFVGRGSGFKDGNRMEALFDNIDGLTITRDAKTLYACDSHNNRLRRVDTATGDVSTAAGDGRKIHMDGIGTVSSIESPRRCTFYRSPKILADTVLFITAQESIRRFDVATGKMSVLFDFLGVLTLYALR
jgi:hypothetical protein